ncbi:MAG: hypothetical protein ABIW34_14195 [Ginsengibacter sp.]
MHLHIIFTQALHRINCTIAFMLHSANEYYFKAMDRSMPYYFSIESINENGVSKRTNVIKVIINLL